MQEIGSFIIYPGLLVVGWISATLINYLCDTLPETRKFSQILCLHCHHPIRLLDYILMKPCPSCSRSRKIRSWIVMFLLICSTFILEEFTPGRLGFWPGMVVVTYFILVAVIDIEHRIIMHPVSIAGGVIGLCIGAWQHGWMGTLIGGVAGLGFMFIVYLVGGIFAKWLAKRKGIETEEEGFGFGDVALSGVLGLLLGWPGIIAGLTLAVLLGGVGSLATIIYSLLAKKYQAFLTIPYGPFLIIGAAILLFRPGV